MEICYLQRSYKESRFWFFLQAKLQTVAIIAHHKLRVSVIAIHPVNNA